MKVTPSVLIWLILAFCTASITMYIFIHSQTVVNVSHDSKYSFYKMVTGAVESIDVISDLKQQLSKDSSQGLQSTTLDHEFESLPTLPPFEYSKPKLKGIEQNAMLLSDLDTTVNEGKQQQQNLRRTDDTIVMRMADTKKRAEHIVRNSDLKAAGSGDPSSVSLYNDLPSFADNNHEIVLSSIIERTSGAPSLKANSMLKLYVSTFFLAPTQHNIEMLDGRRTLTHRSSRPAWNSWRKHASTVVYDQFGRRITSLGSIATYYCRIRRQRTRRSSSSSSSSDSSAVDKEEAENKEEEEDGDDNSYYTVLGQFVPNRLSMDTNTNQRIDILRCALKPISAEELESLVSAGEHISVELIKSNAHHQLESLINFTIPWAERAIGYLFPPITAPAPTAAALSSHSSKWQQPNTNISVFPIRAHDMPVSSSSSSNSTSSNSTSRDKTQHSTTASAPSVNLCIPSNVRKPMGMITAMILEHISHHIAVGVNHVFFCTGFHQDSAHARRLRHIFASYIAEGRVTLIYQTVDKHAPMLSLLGMSAERFFVQTMQSNACLYLSKGWSDYVIVLDTDEFLVPKAPYNTLQHVLSLITPTRGADGDLLPFRETALSLQQRRIAIVSAAIEEAKSRIVSSSTSLAAATDSPAHSAEVLAQVTNKFKLWKHIPPEWVKKTAEASSKHHDIGWADFDVHPACFAQLHGRVVLPRERPSGKGVGPGNMWIGQRFDAGEETNMTLPVVRSSQVSRQLFSTRYIQYAGVSQAGSCQLEWQWNSCNKEGVDMCMLDTTSLAAQSEITQKSLSSDVRIYQKFGEKVTGKDGIELNADNQMVIYHFKVFESEFSAQPAALVSSNDYVTRGFWEAAVQDMKNRNVLRFVGNAQEDNYFTRTEYRSDTDTYVQKDFLSSMEWRHLEEEEEEIERINASSSVSSAGKESPVYCGEDCEETLQLSHDFVKGMLHKKAADLAFHFNISSRTSDSIATLPHFAANYSDFVLGSMIERESDSFRLYITTFLFCHDIFAPKQGESAGGPTKVHPDAYASWFRLLKETQNTEYETNGIRRIDSTGGGGGGAGRYYCKIHNDIDDSPEDWYYEEGHWVPNHLTPDSNANKRYDILRCPMRSNKRSYVQRARHPTKKVRVEIFKNENSLIRFEISWATRATGYMLDTFSIPLTLKHAPTSKPAPTTTSSLLSSSSLDPWRGFDKDIAGRWDHDKLYLSIVGVDSPPTKENMPLYLENIQHHLSLGVEHIFFTVTSSWSSAGMQLFLRTLKPFIDSGRVTVSTHSGDGFDLIYSVAGLVFDRDNFKNLAVNLHTYYSKGMSDYVAVWDVDEFFIPRGGHKDIIDVLRSVDIPPSSLQSLYSPTADISPQSITHPSEREVGLDRRGWADFDDHPLCYISLDSVVVLSAAKDSSVLSNEGSSSISSNAVRGQHVWVGDRFRHSPEPHGAAALGLDFKKSIRPTRTVYQGGLHLAGACRMPAAWNGCPGSTTGEEGTGGTGGGGGGEGEVRVDYCFGGPDLYFADTQRDDQMVETQHRFDERVLERDAKLVNSSSQGVIYHIQFNRLWYEASQAAKSSGTNEYTAKYFGQVLSQLDELGLVLPFALPARVLPEELLIMPSSSDCHEDSSKNSLPWDSIEEKNMPHPHPEGDKDKQEEDDENKKRSNAQRQSSSTVEFAQLPEMATLVSIRTASPAAGASSGTSSTLAVVSSNILFISSLIERTLHATDLYISVFVMFENQMVRQAFVEQQQQQSPQQNRFQCNIQNMFNTAESHFYTAPAEFLPSLGATNAAAAAASGGSSETNNGQTSFDTFRCKMKEPVEAYNQYRQYRYVSSSSLRNKGRLKPLPRTTTTDVSGDSNDEKQPSSANSASHSVAVAISYTVEGQEFDSIVKFLVPWESRITGFLSQSASYTGGVDDNDGLTALSATKSISNKHFVHPSPWRGYPLSLTLSATKGKSKSANNSGKIWDDSVEDTFLLVPGLEMGPSSATIASLLEFIQHHLSLGVNRIMLSTSIGWKTAHLKRLFKTLQLFHSNSSEYEPGSGSMEHNRNTITSSSSSSSSSLVSLVSADLRNQVVYSAYELLYNNSFGSGGDGVGTSPAAAEAASLFRLGGWYSHKLANALFLAQTARFSIGLTRNIAVWGSSEFLIPPTSSSSSSPLSSSSSSSAALHAFSRHFAQAVAKETGKACALLFPSAKIFTEESRNIVAGGSLLQEHISSHALLDEGKKLYAWIGESFPFLPNMMLSEKWNEQQQQMGAGLQFHQQRFLHSSFSGFGAFFPVKLIVNRAHIVVAIDNTNSTLKGPRMRSTNTNRASFKNYREMLKRCEFSLAECVMTADTISLPVVSSNNGSALEQQQKAYNYDDLLLPLCSISSATASRRSSSSNSRGSDGNPFEGAYMLDFPNGRTDRITTVDRGDEVQVPLEINIGTSSRFGSKKSGESNLNHNQSVLNAYADIYFPSVRAQLHKQNLDLLVEFPESIGFEALQERRKTRGWIPFVVLFNATQASNAASLNVSWNQMTATTSAAAKKAAEMASVAVGEEHQTGSASTDNNNDGVDISAAGKRSTRQIKKFSYSMKTDIIL